MSHETIVIVIDVIVIGLAIYGVFYGIKRKRWVVVGLCVIVLVWEVLAFLSSSLVIGIAAYQRGDFGTAERILRRHADTGSPEAQLHLGVMYADGQGVPENPFEAVKWYRKAAEQGYAQAQHNLGVSYDEGQGVPQDHLEAVKWMRKAAEQGFLEAQHNLAVSYATGQGVSQDYVRACAWSNAAALGGHDDSRELRDTIMAELTPAQREQAGKLSEEIIRKHRKD